MVLCFMRGVGVDVGVGNGCRWEVGVALMSWRVARRWEGREGNGRVGKEGNERGAELMDNSVLLIC